MGPKALPLVCPRQSLSSIPRTDRPLPSRSPSSRRRRNSSSSSNILRTFNHIQERGYMARSRPSRPSNPNMLHPINTNSSPHRSMPTPWRPLWQA